ncbi:hypothetical protein PVAND_006457 [Polypedilum vanderplanki]|uniref:Lipoprotein n=1 Tax=Polypedilum vanderplanki TaxID=319348 RepID=A0A9J6C404_POLVA|nr:hypothetical protein PVAND_006457 [Polypedilum vanderplanki]
MKKGLIFLLFLCLSFNFKNCQLFNNDFENVGVNEYGTIGLNNYGNTYPNTIGETFEQTYRHPFNNNNRQTTVIKETIQSPGGTITKVTTAQKRPSLRAFGSKRRNV